MMAMLLDHASGQSGFHFTVSFALSRLIISFFTYSCFHVSWGNFTKTYYICINSCTKP